MLQPDCLVILREHDKRTENDSLLFRLEHILYSINEDDAFTMDQLDLDYYDNYYSRKELKSKFKEYDFEYVGVKEVDDNIRPNQTNYYYIVFRCNKELKKS